MRSENIFIIIFFLFISIIVGTLLIGQGFDLVYKQKTGESSKIDWGNLLYFGEFFTYIDIENSENFIQESLFKSEEFMTNLRGKVLKDILGININYEITIKDLIESNTSFLNEFTKRFYSSDIIIFSGQIGDRIKMTSSISFLGENNIIDIILKSRYFFEELKLKPMNSEYTPYSHNGLIIEARHLEITPSIFPNIYSYDDKGNIVLVYSVNHSDKKEIVKKGYVHFYVDIQTDMIEKNNFYYCAAIRSYGTKKVDIVISREDYIKFFSSPVSLKNLASGNFYIVLDPKKVKM